MGDTAALSETALREVFEEAAESICGLVANALAERPPTDWLGGVSIVTAPFYDSPVIDRCEEALAKSVVYEPFTVDDQIYVTSDDGSMTVGAPRQLAFTLLTHAAATTFWSNREFNCDAYVQRVGQLIEHVVPWLNGETVELEATQVIAFYNIYLPQGHTIELPFGTLRPSPHAPVMPETLKLGPVLLTPGLDDWGDAPSAILVRTFPVGAHLTTRPTDNVQRRAIEYDPAMLAEKLALAIVLACGHFEHSSPAFAGLRSSNPLTGGAGSGQQSRAGQRPPGIPMPESVTVSVQRYAARIKEIPVSGPLMFAGRRLLRSLNADHIEDALVDAVIVWEALFSVQPETAFRVTSAVARTLQAEFTDGEPLPKFQSFLSKIYGARSAIVHGDAATRKDYMRYPEYTLNAKRYAWRLLRRAYLWPQDILDMDSGKRSQLAILGDWPPSTSEP